MSMLTLFAAVCIPFQVAAAHKPGPETQEPGPGGKMDADPYEPDNLPASATPIDLDATQTHTIHVNGDVDWLSLTLQQDQVVCVQTANLRGSNADTVLEIYDDACTFLDTDDDGGNEPWASRLVWTATYSGVHYVKARTYPGFIGSCDDQGGGQADCSYDITVAELEIAGVANDPCASPTVIASVPYDPPALDTTQATTDPGDPLQSCTSNVNSNSVWYTYTPSCRGLLEVSTCGSSYDTVLAVYTGTCDNLTEIACNDDSCSLQSEIRDLVVEVGDPLLIEVTDYGSPGGGNLALHLDFQCGGAPPGAELVNDHCPDAVVIEAVPFDPPLLDTTQATTDAGDPLQSCTYDGLAANANSVWYTYTPARHGLADISTCGSDYDTVLTVYTGTCGELTEIACNDDSCDLQSAIRDLVVEADVPLLIEVTQYDTPGGGNLDFEFDFDCCVLADAPTSPQPADGAVDVPADTVLSWNEVSETNAARRRALVAEGASRPKVIYGDDDRLDEYQVSDPDLLRVGDSTVALIDIGDLTDNGDGTYSLASVTFGDTLDVCPSEPFRDQPNPAFCSGFLVGADIIATAGHCITDAGECADTAFVFGFTMRDANTPVLTIEASDVYFCRDIIAREVADADWGLIRLDRQVTGHAPLVYRTTGKVSDEEPLVVIGHPVGLPRKYAGGANVRDNALDPYFTANLDTYGGNSGSAVFSASTLIVEGILVRGEDDFATLPPPDDCLVSRRCPDDACGGEAVTRTTAFVNQMAELEYDVYLGPCNDLQYMGTSISPTWTASRLLSGTTYCWQIVARTGCGPSAGPVWEFTTAGTPPAPQKVCEPGYLDFADDGTSLTFQAYNATLGNWAFDIIPNQSWISVSPASGLSSGPSDRCTVTVTVDRTWLCAGTRTGQIDVDGATVDVSLKVPNRCGIIDPFCLIGLAVGFLMLSRLQSRRNYGSR